MTSLPVDPSQRGGCPRCGAVLVAADVPPHGLLGCGSCGGVFLNHSGVRALLAGGHFGVEAHSARLAGGATSRPSFAEPAECPICASPMTPVDIHARGVRAHTCNAHGSWFDAGDVGRVRPPPVAATGSPRLAALEAYSYASLPARLGAHVLDGLFLAPGLGIMFVLGAADASSLLVVAVGFLSLAVSLCLQGYWAVTRGQTFGKRQLRIRVVRTNGSRAGAFRILILRNFVPYCVIPWAVAGFGALLTAASGEVPAALLLSAAVFIWPLMFIAQFGILLVLLPAGRALHDYIAGTIVIPA